MNRRWHLSALAAAALIVSGCGGGDSVDAPLATRVIAFGDSLTDIGAYTPAADVSRITSNTADGLPPFFGGKFTTNSFTGYTATSNTNNAAIWVEWIAARLGVVITPHEVGFGPVANRRKCLAALQSPALAGTCTGYAQGGSRVTSPAGIGNPNGNGVVVVDGAPAPAAMTIPLVQQVADHHARFSGFGSGDIVFVFGGNNDVFIQAGLVGAGAITPTQAGAAVAQAATELATLVKDEVLAKGAKRVAVMTLPDSALTPYGAALSAQGRGLLTQLSAGFNTALLAGLDGSDAKIIDARALFGAAVANPGAFGLTNATTPACGATAFNPDPPGPDLPTSLLCNASPAALFARDGVPNLNGLVAGADPAKWVFADGVHPTTGGHKAFADQVWAKVKEFGWAPSNL